jgi:hypothetical protein
MPMLFAWERGNLIVPCFTFFVLGHGRLLKSAWARWLCVAASINFKPYLVLALAGQVFRTRWRWMEGVAVTTVLVFMSSYALYGAGNPIEIINNTITFGEKPVVFSADAFAYTTTYKPILEIFKNFPIMHFVGSRPMELMEAIVPVASGLGTAGVLTCFAGALLQSGVLTIYRLTALGIALVMTNTEAGLYSESFFFFFIFMEKWRGFGLILALTMAYIMCIPFDWQVIRLAHQYIDSYLSGRMVGYDIGLTIGQFIRPTLVLLVEYGLVIASLSELLRAGLARRTGHADYPSEGDVSPASPGSRV